MSARERAPRISRVLPGCYFVEEGEGRGWFIEDRDRLTSPMPIGASGVCRWLVTSGNLLVSEHFTLADARASLPPVPSKKESTK